MTRLREIGHVLVKDLQEARRLLLLYLAVVVAATAHAMALGVFAAAPFGMSMLFVVLVGVLLTASVVQADSPTRNDAFWATHPFHRSSMLGAKFVFALLVILIAAIGQALGVRSYDLSPFASTSLVVGPALLFGMVLLGVALLASVTRDLRSFIIAAIVIPIVVVFVTSMLDRPRSLVALAPQPSALGDLREPLQVLELIAAPALLVWLYLRRDDRRRAQVLACGVVTLTLMTMCSGSSTPAAGEGASTKPPSLDITLEPLDPRVDSQPGHLPVVVHVRGISKDVGALLELSSMDIHLRDGSLIHTRLENPRIEAGGTWASHIVLPQLPGVRWLSDERSGEVRSQVSPQLTGAERRALARGVASVAVDARVSIWEALASRGMPLAVGSEVTAKGRRTRITAWAPDDERSTVVVDESSLDTTGSAARLWMSTFRMQGFALVNESKHEATPLDRTQSSGGLAGLGLVLPGAPLRSEEALRVGPGGDTTLPDAEWLSGARLMRITNHDLGSYRIRLELKEWPSAVGASRDAAMARIAHPPVPKPPSAPPPGGSLHSSPRH